MTAAPRSTTPLIDAAELAAALGSAVAPTVVDVRWTLNGPPGLAEFRAGHLPGAQWADLDTELSGPTSPGGAGGRHPLPSAAALATVFRRLGISRDRPVVAYDAGTSLSAARLWWLLTDAGHPDVRVLDGGLAAWVAAGHPLETGAAAAVAPGDFDPQPGRRARVDGDELATMITEPDHPAVLDVRAAERYAASQDPIDPIAGHVPGAVSAPSMDNLAAGRFRPAAAIRLRYRDHHDPVLYCGSGITAAHSLLALESAGLTGRIYPGSWSDWITDPSRPVATGSEPGGAPGEQPS
ncbi:MAG: sulfurtransferase [Propionibacteriaceae bacterium]